MFKGSTGVITWMSNPAQPSFVWQLYHHDLEPNAALFAVRKACEPVHLQLNEKDGDVEVINNLPIPLKEAHATLVIYNLDGSVAYRHEYGVNAPATEETSIGLVDWPTNLSSVHFVKLQLHESTGKLLSDNFYWRAQPTHPDDFTALESLPTVTINAKISRRDSDGKCLLDVTLDNPGSQVALMTHLQLRRKNSGERVLPVYYTDNYISLAPGETKTISIEAAASDLKGETPLVVIDGWNIAVEPLTSSAAALAVNEDAQVGHWPTTGLPFFYGPPMHQYRIACGGKAVDGFQTDDFCYSKGDFHLVSDRIDTSSPESAPEVIYQAQRVGTSVYTLPMKPLAPGHAYTVRLHFAETTFDTAGKRRFNVQINGARALSNFDILQEAGGKDKALIKTFSGIVPDKDGNVIIEFNKGSDGEPAVSAIEIGRATL
jgi:hypothetical protein